MAYEWGWVGGSGAGEYKTVTRLIDIHTIPVGASGRLCYMTEVLADAYMFTEEETRRLFFRLFRMDYREDMPDDVRELLDRIDINMCVELLATHHDITRRNDLLEFWPLINEDFEELAFEIMGDDL